MRRVGGGRWMISALLIGAFLFCAEPVDAETNAGEEHDECIRQGSRESVCYLCGFLPYTAIGVVYCTQLGGLYSSNCILINEIIVSYIHCSFFCFRLQIILRYIEV